MFKPSVAEKTDARSLHTLQDTDSEPADRHFIPPSYSSHFKAITVRESPSIKTW